MKELPSNVTELIASLDQSYPHRCPKPDDSEKVMWMYAGKRELIDLLIDRSSYKPPKTNTKGTYYHVL